MNSQNYDIVVVGGGGAGLAAAIEGRRAGASVVLLEKNPALGGSTSWSIGSVTATRTPHQIAKGIEDGPDGHYADMPGFAGALQPRDNDALRRVLCDEMPETFRWLLSHGIRFYGPMPEPPHQKPRMHNVLPNSRSFIYHLEHAARRAGVDVRVGTSARELLHEGGRITGVLADGLEGPVRVAARRGVILAAGDFTNAPDLKRRYMGEREARVDAVNPTATGDGQRLGLAAGGRVVNGDLALGPEIRFIAPQSPNLIRRLPPWPWLAQFMAWSLDHMPDALLRPLMMSFLTTALAPSQALFEHGAVLVNTKGERFSDELETPAYDIPEQPGAHAYILADARLARQFSAWPHFISTAPGIAYAYIDDYRRNRRDVYASAGSLGELAAKLRMAGGKLEDAVAAHNRAQTGASPRRNLPPLPPISEPPFIALGPVRAVFVHSEGGLAVDTSHRVLGQDDKPISGLFAAGSTGQGGLLLKGHGHHLAWAFASGRRAGRIAAGAESVASG